MELRKLFYLVKKIFFSKQLKLKNDDYGKIGIKQNIIQALPPYFLN